MKHFISKNLWRIIALVIMALTVGVIVVFRGKNPDAQPQTSSVDIQYDKLGDIIFSVEIDTVRRGTLVQYITANGSVRAAQSVDIVARTAGFLEQTPPPNGTLVQKAQVVARFDAREAVITLKEAEDKRIQAQVEFGLAFREHDTSGKTRESLLLRQAQMGEQLKKAEEKLQELEQLRASLRINAKEYQDKKTVLETEMLYAGAQRTTVMQSKSGLSAANNAVERARLQLEFCTHKTPFSGVIANSNLTAGQYVQAGHVLCKVLDVSSLLIDVGVLETELPFMKLGTAVTATFQALPGVNIPGTVISINPLADPGTKTYTLTVKLQENGKRIAPGMFASVQVVAREIRNCVLLPRAALLSRDKRNVVFSLINESEKNTAHWNYVETGASNDHFVEITSGVEPGTPVMTEGHFTLAHGAPVKIAQKSRK